MTNIYEKYIVEIKKEYLTYLINILCPLIYEGFQSIYKESIAVQTNLLNNATIRNDIPSELNIFQRFLKTIPTWNNSIIEDETNRIKEKSKCSQYFDNLIKAVIKSYVLLLSCSKKDDIGKKKYYDRISVYDFVHKCYIESSIAIYNCPQLFWHKYSNIKIKENQLETCKIIKKSIKGAIIKMLPINDIVIEFLKHEFKNNDNLLDSQYININALMGMKSVDNNFEEIDSDNQLSGKKYDNVIVNNGDAVDDVIDTDNNINNDNSNNNDNDSNNNDSNNNDSNNNDSDNIDNHINTDNDSQKKYQNELSNIESNNNIFDYKFTVKKINGNNGSNDNNDINGNVVDAITDGLNNNKFKSNKSENTNKNLDMKTNINLEDDTNIIKNIINKVEMDMHDDNDNNN